MMRQQPSKNVAKQNEAEQESTNYGQEDDEDSAQKILFHESLNDSATQKIIDLTTTSQNSNSVVINTSDIHQVFASSSSNHQIHENNANIKENFKTNIQQQEDEDVCNIVDAAGSGSASSAQMKFKQEEKIKKPLVLDDLQEQQQHNQNEESQSNTQRNSEKQSISSQLNQMSGTLQGKSSPKKNFVKMNIERMKKLQNKKTIMLQANKKVVKQNTPNNVRESNIRNTKGMLRERHQSLITQRENSFQFKTNEGRLRSSIKGSLNQSLRTPRVSSKPSVDLSRNHSSTRQSITSTIKGLSLKRNTRENQKVPEMPIQRALTPIGQKTGQPAFPFQKAGVSLFNLKKSKRNPTNLQSTKNDQPPKRSDTMRISHKFNQHQDTTPISTKSKNAETSKALNTSRNINLFQNQKLNLDANISPNNNATARGKNKNFKGASTKVLELSLCTPTDDKHNNNSSNKNNKHQIKQQLLNEQQSKKYNSSFDNSNKFKSNAVKRGEIFMRSTTLNNPRHSIAVSQTQRNITSKKSNNFVSNAVKSGTFATTSKVSNQYDVMASYLIPSSPQLNQDDEDEQKQEQKSHKRRGTSSPPSKLRQKGIKQLKALELSEDYRKDNVCFLSLKKTQQKSPNYQLSNGKIIAKSRYYQTQSLLGYGLLKQLNEADLKKKQKKIYLKQTSDIGVNATKSISAIPMNLQSTSPSPSHLPIKKQKSMQNQQNVLVG